MKKKEKKNPEKLQRSVEQDFLYNLKSTMQSVKGYNNNL